MPLYQLKIKGRVQGVYYRHFTKKEAEKWGIKGIVRNEADGSVYAEIEGEEEALQAMIDWCNKGPTHAEVNAVEVSPAPEKGYDTFRIVR